MAGRRLLLLAERLAVVRRRLLLPVERPRHRRRRGRRPPRVAREAARLALRGGDLLLVDVLPVVAEVLLLRPQPVDPARLLPADVLVDGRRALVVLPLPLLLAGVGGLLLGLALVLVALLLLNRRSGWTSAPSGAPRRGRR